MKKFLAFLCALTFCAALLAGCGSAGEAPSSAAPSGTVSKTADPVNLRIGALKGPTGMGMVSLMEQADSGALTDNHYEFSIAASMDEVSPLLAKGELDIAAVPANVAAVLYNNNNEGFQVLAINTLGVLNIVENGTSISKVEDLRGKTIFASGKGATPEYALNYILRENGLDPETDVNIEWKSEHAECLSALMAQENGIALLPQPFVTTAQMKNENIRIALDLTKEWEALQTPSALITGVVVARREFVQEHPQAVAAFLDHYKESVDFVNEHITEAAQLVGKYGIVAAEVAEKAIPACHITLIEGAEMKEKLAGYLAVLLEENPQSVGGALPDDQFYFSR